MNRAPHTCVSSRFLVYIDICPEKCGSGATYGGVTSGQGSGACVNLYYSWEKQVQQKESNYNT